MTNINHTQSYTSNLFYSFHYHSLNIISPKTTKWILILTILLISVTQSLQDCISNCVECSSSNPNKCEACSENYYLENYPSSSSSSKCISKKDRCQYYDHVNKTCRYCKPGTVLHMLEGYCESAASKSTGPYLLIFFVAIFILSMVIILYILLTGGYLERIKILFKKSPSIKERRLSKLSVVNSNSQ